MTLANILDTSDKVVPPMEMPIIIRELHPIIFHTVLVSIQSG